MSRYFTHYWTNETWDRERRTRSDGEPLRHVAGNQFLEKGISPGDYVYVVTVKRGKLLLGGKLRVGVVTTSPTRVTELLGTEDFFEASDHVLGRAEESTPLVLGREVPMPLVSGLRFRTPRGESGLKFIASGRLDPQTLRSVRELTPQSAALLDRLLENSKPR